MMKRGIIISVVFLSVFCSCQKEKGLGLNGSVMGDIAVSHVMSLTKCDGGSQSETLFQDMPFVTSSGDTLYLSAELSNMEDVVVEQTKGALIDDPTSMPESKFYTYVFENNAGRYMSKGADEMYKVPVTYGTKWEFDKKYYWPTSDSQILHFVSIGPANLVDDDYVYHFGNTSGGYDWNSGNNTMKLRYQSRKDDIITDHDAENLADLLYGFNSQSKSTDENKVQITLKHACMGVRFEIGNIFGTIESISLQNFYRNGDFTLSSSGISWSNPGSKTEFKQLYNVVANPSLEGKDLDETPNHAKTFMLVPQQVRSDAKMIVSIGGTLHPEELSFEKLFTDNPTLNRNWNEYIGQIITFRLSSTKANNVSVVITDTVDGLTKKDIAISNDGRSDIMIRVKPVGNWLNEDGHVIASWDESNPYGIFEADNGFPTLNNVNWKKGSDGFYYYRKYLKSGKTVSENLFDTYTVTSKPIDASGTWAQGGTKMQITTMELALLVQAVIAESNLASFKAAWGDEMATWIGTPESDE